MEYLRDLKKTNELAKTMVKCGIATNVVEAQDQIKNKETMLVGESEQSVNSEPISVQEIKEAPELTTPDKKVDEIEDFLKRFDPFFAKFHSETVAKLDALTKEIEKLKKQVANGAVVKEEPAVVEEPIAEGGQTTLSEPKEKKEFRQKDGEYSSDDVSVSKIFNNANGRLMGK